MRRNKSDWHSFLFLDNTVTLSILHYYKRQFWLYMYICMHHDLLSNQKATNNKGIAQIKSKIGNFGNKDYLLPAECIVNTCCYWDLRELRYYWKSPPSFHIQTKFWLKSAHWQSLKYYNYCYCKRKKTKVNIFSVHHMSIEVFKLQSRLVNMVNICCPWKSICTMYVHS